MPVPGSGLGSQFAIAEETTWATPVTVTRFQPIDSETIMWKPKAVQGQGLQAGTYVNQGSLRANTSYAVTGDIMMDFTSKSMGLLMKHALGSATIAQNASTAAWTQTWTLGATVNGKGLTAQIGRPQTNGTVVPYTYNGGKVDSWELSCAAEDILKAKFTMAFQNRTTATSLATASYPTANNVFYFKQGAVTFNGSAQAGIRDFTLTGTNSLDLSEYYFNNLGLIAEPVRNNFVGINIKATCDFTDANVSTAFAADTEVGMVLTFGSSTTSAQIATSGFYETLTITLAGLRLNGDEPNVAGPGIVQVNLDADAVTPIAGGTPISIAYTSADTVI